MARPYSLDLRQRVVALVMGGMTCRGVAELNGIAPSTVVKWPGRERETGSPAAKAMGGKRPWPANSSQIVSGDMECRGKYRLMPNSAVLHAAVGAEQQNGGGAERSRFLVGNIAGRIELAEAFNSLPAAQNMQGEAACL